MTLLEEAVYQYLKLICNERGECLFSETNFPEESILGIKNPEILKIHTIEEICEATFSLIRMGYLIQTHDRLKIVFKN